VKLNGLSVAITRHSVRAAEMKSLIQNGAHGLTQPYPL